ncbi:LacI family DNA-binding transcriptional regulator [Deinococcus planocerae]|uniref:LacI family DNA-binding transcriptional regulator n=1 Tax=Deinococcus planocerae TaxID=1737569 RepID=UPI000C7ECE3C|nr:LacI family DNA-binding transcriptional regulator [Deinococcus planocerae]
MTRSARPRRATAADVAQEAGVSQSTVSRVFSDDGRLTRETKDRVRAVARELGYRPHAVARSLITRRTNIVGLVTSDLSNPFYPRLVETFTTRLHALGRRVLLLTAGVGEDLDDLLPEVLSSQVDGYVVASASVSSGVVRECVRIGTPVVLVNRHAPGSGASAVSCDNVAGGRTVADALLAAGCVRPAYVAGREDASTNIERERGFFTRLRERGVTDVRRERGHYTYASGREAARRLLALPERERPDGLFCANDITAMGALDAARELGVRVPQDLAVVGFDDIPAAAWSAYDLTTVRQPVEDMIGRSLDLLLAHVERPDLAPELEVLPGTLVERGSSRRKGQA